MSEKEGRFDKRYFSIFPVLVFSTADDIHKRSDGEEEE